MVNIEKEYNNLLYKSAMVSRKIDSLPYITQKKLEELYASKIGLTPRMRDTTWRDSIRLRIGFDLWNVWDKLEHELMNETYASYEYDNDLA